MNNKQLEQQINNAYEPRRQDFELSIDMNIEMAFNQDNPAEALKKYIVSEIELAYSCGFIDGKRGASK
ncbi:MAG: hypothetical protein J5934_06425 [Succinivibrio sp.]|nr:hypothetical protein [Succinivibrio sp.]